MGLITNIMDISKYQDFFHDGSIIDISHHKNNIILSMESAELDEEEITDNIPLSKDNSLKGKLYINGVHSIVINKKPFLATLKRTYDHRSIFELSIKKNFIEICIEWVDFPPNSRKEDFSVIEMQAEDIYWENIPDL